MGDLSNPMKMVQSASRVVIKVGTRILTTQKNELDQRRIEKLAEEIVRLRKEGRQVILVSSGAIGAGLGLLGWAARPKELAKSQAAAAVGQGRLMQVYAEKFGCYGVRVAQILLTRDDMAQRNRYLNARQTMKVLLQEGVLPVVNENDTVSVDEIRFGDNDELSVQVAQLMDAQLLVILTDVDGFEFRPATGPRELIPLVERITPELERSAGGAGQPTSTGGMVSKIKAAKTATACGIPMLLANGTREGILETLLIEGKLTGTLFLPSGKRRIESRKRWLAFTGRPVGSVQVDAGAREALLLKGKSLLASGIRKIEGGFKKGDLVSVRDESGEEFARGLVNYPSGDLTRIRGMRSDEISSVLGQKAQEAIHRDFMVILKD